MLSAWPIDPAIVPLAGALVAPVAIVVLCSAAGLGTVLLLPSHFHTSWRRVGALLLLAAALAMLGEIVSRSSEDGRSLAHRVYFWIFACIALFGAIRVVTHPRPVYSALYFVLTVFASAGLFVLLQAPFMAAALVIIYAGAILVTYVFVIMLAVQARSPDSSTPAQQLADYDLHSRDPFIASAIGYVLMGVMFFVIFDRGESPAPAGAESPTALKAEGAPEVAGSTENLGIYLFEHQQASLELAGLLLTVSMVGAIIIARRRVLLPEPQAPAPAERVDFPATPINDDPHSIPVYGTDNPRQKAYPET